MTTPVHDASIAELLKQLDEILKEYRPAPKTRLQRFASWATANPFRLSLISYTIALLAYAVCLVIASHAAQVLAMVTP